MPYHLAPLWDAGVRHRAEELAASKKRAAAKRAGIDGDGDGLKGRVPQDLKIRMKKSKGAKTLLQELEEEIRAFVHEWDEKESRKAEPEVDSEDEEIVFVGRNGTMSDEQREIVEEELEREKLIFDSLADDPGASFGYVASSVVSLCMNFFFLLTFAFIQSLACPLYRWLLWPHFSFRHNRESRS